MLAPLVDVLHRPSLYITHIQTYTDTHSGTQGLQHCKVVLQRRRPVYTLLSVANERGEKRAQDSWAGRTREAKDVERENLRVRVEMRSHFGLIFFSAMLSSHFRYSVDLNISFATEC